MFSRHRARYISVPVGEVATAGDVLEHSHGE